MDSYVDLLAALRTLNMRQYVWSVRLLTDGESAYAHLTELVKKRADELIGENGEGEVDLSSLMPGPAYTAFLDDIHKKSPEIAELVAGTLSRRLDEQALERLRLTDPEAFREALPVLSASDIARAIATGTIVNSVDAEGSPEPVRTDENYSGAFLHRPCPTARIGAADLVEVISRFAKGNHKDDANPKGLRLYQVLVEGTLDLNWLDCPFPLGFEGCSFSRSVSADYAHLKWLSFDTCDFNVASHYGAGSRGSFDAQRLTVDGELRFFRCVGVGQLFLRDSTIGSFVPNGIFGEDGEDGGVSDAAKSIRVVFDGTTFGQLGVPEQGSELFGFHSLPTSVRISRLTGVGGGDPKRAAEKLMNWITSASSGTGATRLSRGVAATFERALRDSGEPDIAVEFGILAERRETFHQGVQGWFKRLFLDRTVSYFYRNMNALKVLAILWFVAWCILFGLSEWAPTQFETASGTEQELPRAWFGTIVDKGVWSFLYSTDLVFSPLSLGIAQVPWPGSSLLSLLLTIIKGASLLFMGLFVTGVSGITERTKRE